MEPGHSPAQLIADSEALLLDFDGPVCTVYAGSDSPRIAREVGAMLGFDIETDDPLDLILHAVEIGGPVDEVHQVLTGTEIEAVRTATETPGIRQLIDGYPGPIAIVSNNAAQAIDAWLTAADLRHLVDVITGRDPRRMKPDPWPLNSTVLTLGIPLAHCIFVGDSLSDAQAARRAGVELLALANKPGKRKRFEAAGCPSIIDELTELLVGIA
jgi:HAD superfamily hydrolase (TIGR01509 family)